jgi:predicted dehydrogenase
MTVEALQAGKHVFVEKPLALTLEDLDTIRTFYERQATNEPTPILMTGFNRRFSPHIQRACELTARRRGSMIVTYRMNAGYIPLTHWVHGPEGGGRNRGEACHIYDLFGALTGSRVTSVQANAIRPVTRYYQAADNFVATIKFQDGSLATLTYTALGSTAYPKEQMEIFVDGQVITMNDYRQVAVVGSADRRGQAASTEKGHKQELEAFGIAIQQGGPWPIPLWQQLQATEISFEVETCLQSR